MAQHGQSRLRDRAGRPWARSPATRAILLLALALAGNGSATAQSWLGAFGGPGDDEWRALVEGPSRSLLAAGVTDSAGAGGFEAWIGRIGPCGGAVWTLAVGAAGDDAALAAAPRSAGGLIAVGETATVAGDLDILLLEIDASGAIVRQRTAGGPGDESAVAVASAIDGGFLVAATVRQTPSAAADLHVMRFDAIGAPVWQRSYGGAGEDEATALVATGDGGAIVAAFTDSFGAGLFDAWLVRLDPAGAVLWERAYGGPGDDRIAGLAITGQTLVASGSTDSFGEGLFDGWIVGIALGDGAPLWETTYGGIDDDEAFAVARRLDAPGAIVTGRSASFAGGGDDVWLLALDAGGAIDWTRRVGGAALDQPAALSVGAHGVAVAGVSASWGGAPYEGWVARLDAAGDSSLPCAPLGNDSLSVGASTSTTVATAASVAVGGAPPLVSNLTATPGPVASSSVCDAGPGEVSPPGAELPLRFDDAISLGWEPSAANCAESFNLYRGALSALAANDFGAALECAALSNAAVDAATPAPAAGYTYLVTAVTQGVEGTPGSGSAGGARPLVPCP